MASASSPAAAESGLRLRRAALYAAAFSIVALPAWLMFGRGLAGAPLGEALLLQAFLGPGLAVLIAVVVGLTVARKSVRDERAFAWRDVKLVVPWLAVIALLGFTVVDTSGARTGSALTAWFGDGWMQASQSFTALGVLLTLMGGAIIAALQARALARETRDRARRFVDGLQSSLLEQPARGEEATFERLDGPQRGRVIRLDGEK